MISRTTGEIVFQDGLRFVPHGELSIEHLREASGHDLLPMPGWTWHHLGGHDSDHGRFEVDAISDRRSRIQIVLLAHSHPFYQGDTPGDAERRAFHEGIIASDLGGQREYSWGKVFCRLDPAKNKDWLVVAYTPGPQVPWPEGGLRRHLFASEPVGDTRSETSRPERSQPIVDHPLISPQRECNRVFWRLDAGTGSYHAIARNGRRVWRETA